MKILVLNPNTSDTVTARIADTVRRIALARTEVFVRRIAHGPEVLESAFDEAAAVPHVLDEVRAAAAAGFDAIVLAAFCDPGLDAAREISDVPVYGLEETTLAVAITLGNRFGILTEKPHKTAVKEQHVRTHGLESRLASVRAVGMGVAEIAADPERVKRVGLEVARRMVEEDGAEVVIMGCAAMAGYSDDIERELRVPVLDPVAVTFKVAEALTAIGVRHSKRGLYARPSSRG
jgi:allantoin racemase